MDAYTEMRSPDGSTVKLSLNFKRLYMLRSKNKTAYEHYRQAVIKLNSEDPEIDDFDQIDILYAAYLCGDVENCEKLLGFEDFLGIIPEDHVEMSMLVGQVYHGLNEEKN